MLDRGAAPKKERKGALTEEPGGLDDLLEAEERVESAECRALRHTVGSINPETARTHAGTHGAR